MGLQPITNFLKPIKNENDTLMPIVKSVNNSVMKQHDNNYNIIKNNTNKLNTILDK